MKKYHIKSHMNPITTVFFVRHIRRQSALHMAEFTVPPSSVEAQWSHRKQFFCGGKNRGKTMGKWWNMMEHGDLTREDDGTWWFDMGIVLENGD